MSQFKQAVNRFLTEQLVAEHVLREGDVFEIERFQFEWADGYHYSSYTYEDSSFSVYIVGKLHGSPWTYRMYNEESTSMGEFLNRLLDQEDQWNAPGAITTNAQSD